jgi:poly-gamma-glutamate synthesis protein (capsule biosynthesis protein)
MVAMACSLLTAAVAAAETTSETTTDEGGIATAPGAATVAALRVDPPGRTFTVAAVGDFLSEGLVNNAAATHAPPGVRFDYEPLLRPVEPLIAGADLAICHMETPVGAPGAQVGFAGKNAYGTNLIAAAAELPGDLVRVGFDRCSTASNHANDLGADGVRTTLEALDGAGLSHTGTARNAEEAAPRVLDVAGVRVGHVAFARNSNTGFPSDWWRVRQGVSAGNVIDDVAAARAAGAEVVIVSLHVYVEMQNAPTAEDRAVVRDIIAGAHPDLIIIHGPHVVQPVERVDGTLVFWSLGNFISGMGVAGRDRYADPRTLDGLLASVRFTEQADGTWLTTPWTVLLCNVLGSRLVYPGLTTLADPTIPAGLRAQLDACVGRSAAVVADLK